MNTTTSPLKAFLGRCWKDGLILNARRMSGQVEKTDWRDVDRLEVQVIHRQKFRMLAYRHDLKVWDMPGHWLGVMEGNTVMLLRSVLNTLHDDFASWQGGEVGLQIAYLALAVVNHDQMPVDETIPWSSAFAETMLRLFPPQHPVWPFISLSDPKHGNPLTH